MGHTDTDGRYVSFKSPEWMSTVLDRADREIHNIQFPRFWLDTSEGPTVSYVIVSN